MHIMSQMMFRHNAHSFLQDLLCLDNIQLFYRISDLITLAWSSKYTRRGPLDS